jgi:hypothetical protein
MSQYETAVSPYGPSCAYSTLATYNTPSGIAVPRTQVSGRYIVPSFSPPGYSTLTGNSAPGCTGYFNIMKAYGCGPDGSCNQQYVTSLCQ